MNTRHLISSLNSLISESQNPDTLDIDQSSTLQIVQKINQQDEQVAPAISEVLPQIAKAVDMIEQAIKSGGRLIYLGAGTSGRLGVLDAVECVPTFGVEEGLVVAVMAGGSSAMFKAKEGSEDDYQAGVADLKAIELKTSDVVVGIAASGRTPYVIGGLKYAGEIGAKTIALSCNPEAEIAAYAELAILPVVGPEVLSGSTRMKSGTAQKMVLNMLSTASMIRLGKSYQNYMIDVKATNEKLYARGTNMIMQITGVSQQEAETALKAANLQVKLAVLMMLTGLAEDKAECLLDQCNGFLRKAIAQYHAEQSS